MNTYNINTESPPCYGGPPPGTYLSTLYGDIFCFDKMEEVKNTSPQKYRFYVPCCGFNNAKIFEIFRFRLRLQIQSTFSPMTRKWDMIRILSFTRSNEEDAQICIEAESSKRPDGRLTDEEVDYIRELDKENSDRLYMKYITWEDIDEYIQSLNWGDDASNGTLTLVGENIRGFASWMSKKACLKIKDK